MGGARSHHCWRADPSPPSPSVPLRGRPLAAAVTTHHPSPPVPGPLSPAAGHPDSRPRPHAFPSVPLPAAARRRACTQSPGGGAVWGVKAAEPGLRGRGRGEWREGSTWKSLSSLKRENLSAISRRPGPAPAAAAASALSTARLHRPSRTAHAPHTGHVRGNARHVTGNEMRRGRGSVPHSGATAWSGVAAAAGRHRQHRPGDCGTPGVGTPRGRNRLPRPAAPSGLYRDRSRPAEPRCASDCRWQRACAPRRPMGARTATRARPTTNEGVSSARACLAAN